MVSGVPILLLEGEGHTIPLAAASLEQGRRWAEADPPDGDLLLESLGVSDSGRGEARRLAGVSGPKVDPVVSVLVGATNGLAYKDLIGTLRSYPIPEIRLPASSGAWLLDIGCSWGRWSIAAARKGYRVIGVDPSLSAIMAARRVARELGLEIDYLCADARFLPLSSGAVDNVFSYSVIQHFSKEDAATAIAEAARVLAPGGYCLIQMPNAAGARSLYHQLRRGFSVGKGFEVRYWSVREMERVFGGSFDRVEMSVHCFFGLGLEASDLPIVARQARWLIRASEGLRVMSGRISWLRSVADSIYVSARK